MKRKTIIRLVVISLYIVVTIGMYIAVDRAGMEYSEVRAMVVSSETKQKKILKKRMTVYEVIVTCEGQEYELENTHGTSAYRPGEPVTAYLSNGRLYANIEGVKTSTPLAKAYFGLLLGFIPMLFATITLTGKIWQDE